MAHRASGGKPTEKRPPRRYRKKCLFCGEWFEGITAQRFCGRECRLRYASGKAPTRPLRPSEERRLPKREERPPVAIRPQPGGGYLRTGGTTKNVGRRSNRLRQMLRDLGAASLDELRQRFEQPGYLSNLTMEELVDLATKLLKLGIGVPQKHEVAPGSRIPIAVIGPVTRLPPGRQVADLPPPRPNGHAPKNEDDQEKRR